MLLIIYTRPFCLDSSLVAFQSQILKFRYKRERTDTVEETE